MTCRCGNDISGYCPGPNRCFVNLSMAQGINRALDESLADPAVLVCGQLVKHHVAGITTGLHAKYPAQVITYPISEALMNSSPMGLSLAGKRPVMIHERMDFLACGMDALINHIPIWPKKCGVKLPLVILAIVGKGHGQGPQHSKNMTHWFENFEGWTVVQPDDPERAYNGMKSAIAGNDPVLYVAHREFLNETGRVEIKNPDYIGLCGASQRHEQHFYEGGRKENVKRAA